LIRRLDIAWNYDLPEGNHLVRLEARNIPEGYHVQVSEALLYSNVDPGSKIYF
jgi:hypothetical protein